MRSVRKCSRTGCLEPAVATLTYAYSDSTAVVGPLATASEPHSYDLCEAHALRLTAPKGWEVVRHEGEFAVPEPSSDELTALADGLNEFMVHFGYEMPGVKLVFYGLCLLAVIMWLPNGIWPPLRKKLGLEERL